MKKMQNPFNEDQLFENVWSKILDKISAPYQHLLGSIACHVGLAHTIPEWAPEFL